MPEPPPTAGFQDISLDDGAPKLDFSFGGETKKDTGGFGAWGKTWDFGSLDNGTAKVDDKSSKKTADKKEPAAGLGDNNPWSVSNKSKKKTTTSYGFDFGELDSGEKDFGVDGDVGETKATDDAWGFSGGSKKDTKKKRDTKVDEATVVADPGLKDDDLLGAWGTTTTTTKKDKKKKGFAWDEEPEPPPPPPIEPPPPAEEEWAFGKTSKKKGKKGIIEEPIVEEKDNLADAGAIDNSFDWGFGAGKTDKKPKKSVFSDFNDNDDLLADPLPPTKPAVTAADGDDWMSSAWGTKKKDKKSKKSGIEDLSASIDFGVTSDSKVNAAAGDEPKSKEKKGKKGMIIEEEPPPPPPAPDAPAEAEDVWSAFGKKDKGKKSKLASPEASIPDPILEVEAEAGAIQDLYADTTGWDELTPKERKKKEREAKKNGLLLPGEEPPAPVIPAVVPDPEPAAGAKDESTWGFGGWGASTKDKKKSKTNFSEFDEEPPPPPPEPKPILKDEVDSGWGTSTKDKKKSTKKKGFLDPIDEPPAPPPAPEPEVQEDNTWSAFTSVSKDKTKKEKGAKKSSFFDTIDEPTEAAFQDTKVKEADTWGTWGTATSTDKKAKDPKKKSFLDYDDEPVVPEPEPEPLPEVKEEDSFYGLSAKDKKKKEKEAAKKKGAASAVVEPELDIVVEPEAVAEKTDDIWGSFATTSKDKKKIGKDVKKKGVTEVEDIKPTAKTSAIVEDDVWGSWATKDKKSGTKSKVKDDLPPPAPSPPAQGLTPEPDSRGVLDDDTWAGLTAVKSKSSSTKKSTTSKTSTLKDKLKKSKDADTFTETEPAADAWPEETAASATKSMWGFASTSTTTKLTKKEREAKAKKEADEQAQKEEEERLAREAEEAEAARVAEEAVAKSSKKKGVKSSKTDTKASKTKDADELLDLLDEPAPPTVKAGKGSKLTKTPSSKEEKKDDDKVEDDYFGTWGNNASSSKKTAGKKDSASKKEIAKHDWANQDDALGDVSKDLDSGFDFDKPTSSSSKIAKAMTSINTSTTKTRTLSSVADRIKALEGKKEDTGKKSKTSDDGLTKDLPLAQDTPSPKAEKKPVDKASGLKSKSTKASKKDATPIAEEKKSKDSVPGSFPGAFDDEFDYNNPSDPSSPEKPKSKSRVLDKKAAAVKSKTNTPKASAVANLDLLDEDPIPAKVSSPPPEDKKAAKKDRPKVERSATSSWGFWGAAPPPAKKPIKEKSKDEDDMPPPTKKEKSPTGLARSKSTRTPKEKDQEDKRDAEKVSKSSESDKDTKVKKAERPSATRGASFSNFVFGGPPPSAMSRSKTTTTARRPSSAASSRPSSRRQSMDGLASTPPEDEVPVTSKAAKLMGMKSSKVESRPSLKKRNSGVLKSILASFRYHTDTLSTAVPDPYPIDDDDMVMIHTNEDPRNDGGSAKPKSKASKSKKEVGDPSSTWRGHLSRPSWSPDFVKEAHADGRVSFTQIKSHNKNMSHDDDVVMVESPTQADPLVTSGPDDMAFVDHPPGLKRSNTGTKKAGGGFFGSFFGGGGGGGGAAAARPVTERSRSQTLTDAEDLPIRTKEKVKRRSRAVDGEEFTTDAPAETDADVEARRAERRAKRDARDQAEEADRAEREQRRKERRDREKADLEARQRKARDRERKEQEEEDRRREEKRARRAAREARIAQEEADGQAEADRRRDERRRLRAQLEAEQSGARDTSKDDRRKSYYAEEEERRKRREDRKGVSGGKDRERSGRKTTSALVDEYHESRSGSGRGIAPPANKTSSWVNSQTDEPPDLPPIEGTVLDPSGQRPRAAADDDKRTSRNRDKYNGMTDAEIEEYRERRKSSRRAAEGKSNSGGSDERDRKERRRRRERDSQVLDDRGYGYDEAPVKTWDGRPALGGRNDSKRRSFLGGLF